MFLHYRFKSAISTKQPSKDIFDCVFNGRKGKAACTGYAIKKQWNNGDYEMVLGSVSLRQNEIQVNKQWDKFRNKIYKKYREGHEENNDKTPALFYR